MQVEVPADGVDRVRGECREDDGYIGDHELGQCLEPWGRRRRRGIPKPRSVVEHDVARLLVDSVDPHTDYRARTIRSHSPKSLQLDKPNLSVCTDDSKLPISEEKCLALIPL